VAATAARDRKKLNCHNTEWHKTVSRTEKAIGNKKTIGTRVRVREKRQTRTKKSRSHEIHIQFYTLIFYYLFRIPIHVIWDQKIHLIRIRLDESILIMIPLTVLMSKGGQNTRYPIPEPEL
jgi:hypothetical protein